MYVCMYVKRRECLLSFLVSDYFRCRAMPVTATFLLSLFGLLLNILYCLSTARIIINVCVIVMQCRHCRL